MSIIHPWNPESICQGTPVRAGFIRLSSLLGSRVRTTPLSFTSLLARVRRKLSATGRLISTRIGISDCAGNVDGSRAPEQTQAGLNAATTSYGAVGCGLPWDIDAGSPSRIDRQPFGRLRRPCRSSPLAPVDVRYQVPLGVELSITPAYTPACSSRGARLYYTRLHASGRRESWTTALGAAVVLAALVVGLVSFALPRRAYPLCPEPRRYRCPEKRSTVNPPKETGSALTGFLSPYPSQMHPTLASERGRLLPRFTGRHRAVNSKGSNPPNRRPGARPYARRREPRTSVHTFGITAQVPENPRESETVNRGFS